MNRWLAVLFLVASIEGAVSLYSVVTVGSGGLNILSANLQSFSIVLNNNYTSLNAAKNSVNAALNGLVDYVNVTYTGLINTYGATQLSLSGILSTFQYFNQSLQNGEQMINSQISKDLSLLTSTLQQAIDKLFQTYSSSLYTLSTSMNMDLCMAKNLTQMLNIPNSIGKLGYCLQQEVNTVNAVTPIAVSTINMLNIYSELNTVQSALGMVQQFISSAQQDAATRNRICADLVAGDIEDAIQSIQGAVSSCSYPMY